MSVNGPGAVRFLESARMYFRPLVPDDADGPYPTWLNDAAVCVGNSHHVYPYSRDQARDYIQHANRSGRDLILAMVVKSGDVHIGNVALANIHPVYRKAEFAILLGEQEYWGQGFGLEAGESVLRHGFTAMNLVRIECGTFAANTAMQRLALALGMKQEGIRRSAAYKDGKFVDIIEFGVMRDEFENRASR